jgi:hypothetical protein
MENKMKSDGDFLAYAKECNFSLRQEQEILDLIHRREESAFERGKACAKICTEKSS